MTNPGNLLWFSCLENPMDGGAWWAAVHGVARSRTRLSDFTFTFHFSLSCIGEGNGNPLQCSCLENPRDGRAWWAAVYGVAESQTWLKRLSSSMTNPCLTSQLNCFDFILCAMESHESVLNRKCHHQTSGSIIIIIFLNEPSDSSVQDR